jgi:hypothetical protein
MVFDRREREGSLGEKRLRIRAKCSRRNVSTQNIGGSDSSPPEQRNIMSTIRRGEQGSKNLHHSARVLAAVLFSIALSSPRFANAEGLPEPPLVLYGTIRNIAESNRRLTSGTLTWQFRKVSSGRLVTFTVPLENVLDQFSYVLLVPMETIISGGQISTNALDVTPTGAVFDRSVISLGTNAVTFVVPAQSSSIVASTNRARIERVDFTVNIPIVDEDQNSLADDWELLHFGYLGVNPDADEDGDHMTNWQEYKAGTDPIDPASNLHFTRISPHPQGGMLLEWASEADVYYALQRAGHIKGPYVDFAVGIPAAPGNLTTYRDSTAPSTGAYYRLHLDRVRIGTLDSDGNGFPDDWERLYFGHLGVNPTQDADGDGLSNLEEFRAGTNPSDRTSALQFVGTEVIQRTNVVLEWSSIYEKRYRLLQADAPNGPYTTLETNLLATPPLNRFTNQITGANRRFYRVQLEN